MKRRKPHLTNLAIGSLIGALVGALVSSGCAVDATEPLGDPSAPLGPAEQQGRPTSDPDIGAPGVLASPELFELVSRWASEAPVHPGAQGLAAASPDLAAYVRRHAPALVDEAEAALQTMGAPAGAGVVIQSGCTCSVWGTFTASSSTQSGNSWSLSSRGAAHDGHIYQAVSGSTSERTGFPASTSTKFLTRIVCSTPSGSACAVGCSAQLYTDAYYSSHMLAEAHVWTIWSRAGTTQVADAVTLDLQRPYAGSVRLAEKGGSVQHSTNGGSYDPNDIVNVVKAGLSIYLAAQTGGVGSALVSNINADTVRSILGIINSATSNNNGSYEAGLRMEYQSYFDGQPILVSYQSDTNQVYGLNLTSQASMKVRGYGYHSETGDLKSSYALAAYIDNFSCDTGVTPPRRTGFWNYDAFSGAPLQAAALRNELGAFFYMGYGAYPDLSASTGTLVQGTCGNAVCEALESPNNCASDCGWCGDGTCRSLFENASSCNADCGYCGDYVCGSNEDASSCNADCGWCGDGLCRGAEDAWNCQPDCGWCDDGICSPSEYGWCNDCNGGPVDSQSAGGGA